MFLRPRQTILYRTVICPPVRLAVSRIRVPARELVALGSSRNYANGPTGGGGFPGGMQFGMQHMERGQALKEFVMFPLFLLTDTC